MISISRENETVKFKIFTDTEWNIETSYKTSHDMYAVLLRRSIEEKIYATLKKIREEAYNEGWADAKAKRKKQNWFNGWF